MVAPSSPSFIPKQPATGKVKKRNTRKVYVLAYISFVFFFGTLIAAAATLFYDLSINSQLASEQQRLTELRNEFNQADFERVKLLHEQIETAKDLLNKHVSILEILDQLEASTVENIQLLTFEIERLQMRNVSLSIEALTDNFNTVLFQREMFAENPVLDAVELEEFKSEPVDLTEEELEDPLFSFDANADRRLVQFIISAQFPPSAIQYQPRDLTVSDSGANEVTIIQAEPVDDVDESNDETPVSDDDLPANESAQ